MMRRILISLAFLSLLSTAAYAQSGRNKGSGRPVAAAREPASSPDSTKRSKPSPPTIVDADRIYKAKETDEKAQILSKPPPSFPHQARGNIRLGYVILRVI